MENRPLVGSRRILLDRGDGRCVCDVQRSSVVSTTDTRRHLEQRLHLLSAFAVISYTKNWACMLRGAGILIGAYLSMTLLRKRKVPQEDHAVLTR